MKFRYLIGALSILALFQNCAEPLDLQQYTSDQSSYSGPVSVSISSQSAATLNVVEGQNLYLFVAITKSPSNANVNYEWRKDTAIIASGLSATSTYQKAVATAADTGVYQVFIKDPVSNEILAQSQTFTVSVGSASVTYNPATLTSGNLVFYLTHVTSDTVGTEAETVNAFCRAKLGATAVATGFTKLGQTANNANRALYLKPGNSCIGSNLTNSICGYSLFALPVTQYSIDCRR